MKALSLSKRLLCSLLLMGFIIAITSSCGRTSKEATSNDDPVTIANEAYVYGLPLVLMDITRRQQTNFDTASQKGAPMNQLSNKQEFPSWRDTGVVSPNVDTYYSIAWGDVSKEPIVLYMPNPNGRFYMMPMLDAFTNVFASPGMRTGDTQGGTFLISSKTWDGILPKGIDNKNHFKCPTALFWLIGRIQCNDREDGKSVVIPIQNDMKFMPLSQWLKPNGIKNSIKIDTFAPKGSPNDIVKDSMSIDFFFNYLNRLLVDNPPAEEDAPVMKRFAKIGVGPDSTFSLGKFDTPTQDSLKNVPENVFTYINTLASKSTGLINGWSFKTSGMGYYGIHYLQRAVISVKGLGANLAEDAVYPSTFVDLSGNIYDGSKNNYKIHYDSLPPVQGFWSLTVYNNKNNLAKNNIDRYAVGHSDRDSLIPNPDGSFDIYIQNQPPPSNVSRNNWLPAPAEQFNLMMRLYWPDSTVLDSTWTPPAVTITGPAVASKKK